MRAAYVDDSGDMEKASADWPVLLPEIRLAADTVQEYASELNDVGAVTHIRLDIIPDGGVSRLRVLGTLRKDGAQ